MYSEGTQVAISQGVLAFIVSQVFFSVIIALISKYIIAARTGGKRTTRGCIIRTSTAAAVIAIFEICSALNPHEPVLAYLTVIVLGLCAVILSIEWGAVFARIQHEDLIVILPFAMLSATAVFFLVENMLTNEARIAIAIALPAISALFFVFAVSSKTDTEGCFRLQRFGVFEFPNVRALLRSSAAMFSNGLLMGFVLCATTSLHDSTLMLIVSAAMIAAALFKVFDNLLGLRRFEIAQAIKVLALAATLCLLPLPYVPPEARCALFFIVIFVVIMIEICVQVAMEEYTRIYRIFPPLNFSVGRLGLLIGLFAGCSMAFIVFPAGGGGSMQSPALLILPAALVAFLQYFVFQDNYAVRFQLSGSDGFVDKDDDMNHLSQMDSSVTESSRTRRCEVFTERFGLTPRQHEILALLARGYPTGLIESTLFISSHTVKAHIYNIYRKANVHSRQELILMLETLPESSDSDDNV